MALWVNLESIDLAGDQLVEASSRRGVVEFHSSCVEWNLATGIWILGDPEY